MKENKQSNHWESESESDSVSRARPEVQQPPTRTQITLAARRALTEALLVGG